MNITDNNVLWLARTARRNSRDSATARRIARRKLARQLWHGLAEAMAQVYDSMTGYCLFWLPILVWLIIIIRDEVLL